MLFRSPAGTTPYLGRTAQGRTVIYETEGAFVISSYQTWRPGAYASERAARYAFKFDDEVLQRLQDAAIDDPDNVLSTITFEALQAA